MEQRISTHWKIPFNMVLHYGIRSGRYSMIRNNPARTLGVQQHTRMELAYRFGKRAVFQLHYAYAQLPKAAAFHAFDVSANIQASSRWKFSVQALNLFNTRYYRIVGIDQASSFNHQQLLRGRSYLVGVQYGF
jgi:outer membrane receptor protein involved in Fe transport